MDLSDHERRILAGIPKPRAWQRPAQPISGVLRRVVQQRGYAAIQASQALEATWREVVGEPLASCSAAGSVQAGKLQVRVSSSAAAQELSLRRQEILQAFGQRMPEARITGWRLRIG
jgi:predicted nucleic acid-binding Zn ribbon protein